MTTNSASDATAQVITNVRAGLPSPKVILIGLGVLIALGIGIAQHVHSTQPASRDELCGAYSNVERQVFTTHVLSDNVVFRAANKLGDVASRYEASTTVQAEAKALHHIGDSKSTSGMEIMQASTAIAGICGHPLGFGTNGLR